MPSKPGKVLQFVRLVCLLAAVLGQVYNLPQVNEEESFIDLEELLQNIQSSLTKIDLDRNEIKKTVVNRLDSFEKTAAAVKCVQCEEFSAMVLSFRELVNATLQKAKAGDNAQQTTRLRHCADVYDQKSQLSGIYTIQPPGSKPFQVYCDMRTDGGGWTVFQKRGRFFGIPQDNFDRGWEQYKDGFGDLQTEFWIGLSKVSIMTRPENGYQELRVDLSDWEGNKTYAKYQNFTVEGEEQDFALRIGSYSGDAGDSLAYSNLKAFSTSDHDNDRPSRNCALERSGGWWYDNCSDCCLNGSNLKTNKTEFRNGIYWFNWRGEFYSLSQTEMKFRPTAWDPKK